MPKKLALAIKAAGGAEAYWSNLGAKFPDGSPISEPDEQGGGMTAGYNSIASLELMEKHIAEALKSGDTPTMTWLEEKVEAIILPKVEFKNASIEEAIDFLRQQARAHDPQQRGVNIIGRVPMDRFGLLMAACVDSNDFIHTGIH